ncbi:uncharacterized protein LOC129310497 [Prosopis cineraria]|uniref:uncharacterized protein LOC129310497 n=1 Tax=Prosopis cineraria TaxID=364024 RepID=UPI00240FB575|nr:uncharacterized protein LOC129310497 [Prosopis cineraria]
MQSSRIIVSSPLSPLSTSKSSSNGRNKASRLLSTATMASRRSGEEGDQYGGSWMVDENMIILRKRIHEMKKIEKKYVAPSDWMEWEKQCYCKNYDSMVCEAAGVLQTLLMNTRPGMALGIVVQYQPFGSWQAKEKYP